MPCCCGVAPTGGGATSPVRSGPEVNMQPPLLLRFWRLRLSFAQGRLLLAWQHRDGTIAAFLVLP